MKGRLSTSRWARRWDSTPATGLGVIGLLSAGFVLASTFTPSLSADRDAVRLVALATALLAGLMFLPAWRRVPARATLVMVPVALLLIAVHNATSGEDPYRYGVFYLLLFVWVGAYHPRWTSLAALPLAALSYTVPLALLHDVGAVWTAVYAVPVFVVVGEVIAARSQALLTANVELQRLAHTDPLTGLLDRRAFTTRTEALHAAGEPSLVVVFLDLDGFKAVNDTLGHAAGDSLLQRIAAYLTADLRSGDLLGRLGGDEFAVLLRDTSPDDEPVVLARLRAAVAEAVGADSPVPVGVSAGLVRLDDHPDLEAALRAADDAMYAAKRSARAAR